MKVRNGWIMPLALFMAVAAGIPQKAEARCVDGYLSCLNNTWYTAGITRVMADVACFAQYVGCVVDLVHLE